jgi:hypothetical protein
MARILEPALSEVEGVRHNFLCPLRFAAREPAAQGVGPTEFLVDTSGTVRWTNFTEDIRIRAKADEMLAAAKGLK